MKITITTDDENHFFAIPSELMPEFRKMLELISGPFKHLNWGAVAMFDEKFMQYGFDLEKEFDVVERSE